MILVINYGLGNINAFSNILKDLNTPFKIGTCVEDFDGVTKIILPGVGSFDWAMQKLNRSGLRSILDELVITKKIPVLGVCVGMQIMANYSEEGKEKGLGWINANVLRFKQDQHKQPSLPHMGWNKVDTQDNLIFKGIKDPKFYFLHSYYVQPLEIEISNAWSNYSHRFTCSIKASENIFGVQFHPEKSHFWGKKLISNFVNL